jgi:hypothetical protein
MAPVPGRRNQNKQPPVRGNRCHNNVSEKVLYAFFNFVAACFTKFFCGLKGKIDNFIAWITPHPPQDKREQHGERVF